VDPVYKARLLRGSTAAIADLGLSGLQANTWSS